jgi:3-oxoacyl-[acyl-carrier protein] reductase
MRFADKVVLVTGAAGGIGSAIAEAFAHEGARIGLVDVSTEAGTRLAARLAAAGHTVRFAAADVGRYPDCERAHNEIAAALGSVDILVNNAGISPKTNGHALKVWEMPPEEWDKVVDVNLNSAFYLTRLVTPQMIQKKAGRVINMSSVAGKAWCDFVAAHYAATKAALLGATRHWAAELGPHGITVNGLAPGRISTPLIQTVAKDINDSILRVTPLGRFGTPNEVADVCRFLASDDAAFVTGQVIDVAGGWMMT